MSNVFIPYADLGKASFEQLDTYLQSFLLVGDEPRLTAYPFTVEENQTLAIHTVVGLNARGKLVPATVTDAETYYVSGATLAAGGTGGTPGAATVTGTTGTGTKFQASVTIGAGGNITAVGDVTVQGSYTVAPTDDTAEPVTGGSLSDAELAITVETLHVKSNVIAPIGVLAIGLTTAVGESETGAPVYFSGAFNLNALTWDSSYANETDKLTAFNGAPTPTTIIVKKRQGDA
jgi:hypothetical protein